MVWKTNFGIKDSSLSTPRVALQWKKTWFKRKMWSGLMNYYYLAWFWLRQPTILPATLSSKILSFISRLLRHFRRIPNCKDQLYLNLSLSLRVHKKLTPKQRRAIKILSQNKLFLWICRLVFVVCNEEYFSLLTSLLSMYSLSVSHILAKLSVMVTRFPNSVLYSRIVCLMVYYSFTISFSFFILLNKLLCDLETYRFLVKNYHKICEKRFIVKKRQKKIFRKKQKDTNKRVIMTFQKDRLKLKTLNLEIQEKLDFKKVKLSKIQRQINYTQVKAIKTSFSLMLQLFLLVLGMFLLNHTPILLFFFVILIEIINSILQIKLNSKSTAFFSTTKDLFLFFIFLFMFFSKYFQKKEDLNYYFDFFSLVYLILFLVLSFLIHKSHQLPKIGETNLKTIKIR